MINIQVKIIIFLFQASFGYGGIGMDGGLNPATGGSDPRWAGNTRECKIRIWE
jgi:hypothetical protein